MKITLQSTLTLAAALFVTAFAANLSASETNNATVRIGVYDSRLLAYAHFSTPEHMRQIQELIKTARAARDSGQTNQLKELSARLRQQQDEIHREIFSTAPATDAMAALKNRLPEIEKEAGVSGLISKWDQAALQQYPDAEKVDVTDRLVQEFHPTEKQLKTISGLEKSKPLPLDQCDELIRQGKI